LERCPNCKAELLFEGSEFCDHCGASLKEKTDASPSPDGERDLDFVVTEAREDRRDLVGGVSAPRIGDDLPLQTSSQLMNELTEEESRSTAKIQQAPIGSSGALIPDMDVPAVETKEETINTPPTSTVPPVEAGSLSDDKHSIRKLSDQELKSIEQNLYGSASYLSEAEKKDLMKHVVSTQPAFGTDPIVPPKTSAATTPSPEVSVEPPSELPKPVMAKRGRAVAYYFKNIIQLQAGMELRDQDEINVNDRVFVLRKKRMNSKVTLGIGAGLFAVALLIIGSFFVSSAGNGTGEIIGIVLDAHDTPYVHGAKVRFPDLGRSFTSNGQGFFRAEGLPVGSHKLEYALAGGAPVVDYATVTNGGITTISLSPSTGRVEEIAEAPKVTPKPAVAKPQVSSSASQTAKPQAVPPAETRPPVPASSGQPQVSQLRLAANVEGARLTLDGKVVGAGNLTYSRLKPGRHQYSVSKEGWQTSTGAIELRSGETSVLEVALAASAAPASPRQPAKAPKEDPLAEGSMLADAGDYAGAIAKFSEAITSEPGNASAYMARGESYLSGGDKPAAYADFVRAAEINRVGKSYGPAIAAYNKAIEADPQAVNAYLGRADLYLAQDEAIAATADYETVTRLDRRNAAAYAGLGQARFSQGNLKEAIKQFKSARDLDPKNPEIYQFLLLSYLATDDLKNVKKTYEKFKENVSEADVSRMAADDKFQAVMRIVQGD
jgi:tetratricopeptide (TPR) repeat protein